MNSVTHNYPKWQASLFSLSSLHIQIHPLFNNASNTSNSLKHHKFDTQEIEAPQMSQSSCICYKEKERQFPKLTVSSASLGLFISRSPSLWLSLRQRK